LERFSPPNRSDSAESGPVGRTEELIATTGSPASPRRSPVVVLGAAAVAAVAVVTAWP
jgi:hypothetical protein